MTGLNLIGLALWSYMAFAGAQNIDGVSNPIYECTDDSATPRLRVEFDGFEEVRCGDLVPMDFTRDAPVVAFEGAVDLEYEFYTVLLLNPDDLIPIAPITHHGHSNIPAEDVARGELTGLEWVEYFGPNPPANIENNFTYVYMLLGQAEELESIEGPGWNGDVQAFLDEYSLTIVEQNYFLSTYDLEVDSNDDNVGANKTGLTVGATLAIISSGILLSIFVVLVVLVKGRRRFWPKAMHLVPFAEEDTDFAEVGVLSEVPLHTRGKDVYANKLALV